MQKEEAQKLFKKLNAHYGANAKQEVAEAYYAMFLRSDSSLARKTVDWLIQHPQGVFIPNPTIFARRMREFQLEISQREAQARNPLECEQCKGATWVQDPNADAYHPCPNCRPSSYARWAEGQYRVGTLLPDEELQGPTDSYALASEPQYRNLPPVSVERARQWQEHISQNSGYTYPEEVPAKSEPDLDW